MKLSLSIIVGVALGINNAVAATNTNGAAPRRDSVSTNTAAPDSQMEQEYKKLLEDDDAAQAEVDKWIKENTEFAAKGAGVPDAELNRRIHERFEPIKKRYEDFIKRNPKHVKARVAYGSFLGDIHDEDGAQEQLEQALELEKKDPAIYNNLANIYGHTGDVKKAFEYYAKAIELNSEEPV